MLVGLTDQEGHQLGTRAGAIGRGPGYHGHVGDGGVGCRRLPQCQFDLHRLHPVTAHLHLVAAATVGDQRPVGQAPSDVAGAIQPHTRRLRPEHLVGEVGSAVVAVGQGDSGDADLTGDTVGHGQALLVQHQYLDIVDRGTDWRQRGELPRITRHGEARDDVGFGWTVLVFEYDTVDGGAERSDLIGDPQLLPRRGDDPQT